MIDIDFEPLTVNVDPRYQWTIFERVEKQEDINQSLTPGFLYISTLINFLGGYKFKKNYNMTAVVIL